MQDKSIQNIIDRLELQSDAFQETFDMLSRAKTLEELAKKFFHVLRGSLLVVNAAILFKNKETENWRMLFSKAKNSYGELLGPQDEFAILDLNHPEFQVSVNQPLIDNAIFRILLGAKLDKSAYTEFDKIALQFFLQQLGSAYQSFMSRKKEKQLVFSLNHRVLQLNSLIDTGIEVARLQEDSQLFHLALERVLALTNASKGLLLVKNGRKVIEKIFFPFKFKTKSISQSKFQITTEFSFAEKKYCFYLYEKESRAGIISFDATDQLLLDAFGRQVFASMENHYLHKQSLEKERVEKEISLAGDIQKKLIPEELPKIAGYDQCGINIPTKFIGGDFYDCIPLQDGRYMFIMADVSGKGVAAGLLVSTLHASVHAYLDHPFELAALVQNLNTIIWDSSTLDKYITAFFAVIEPKTGVIESVNAGHNPTYILRKNNTVDELSTGGIPLGMMQMAFPYESSESVLNPGDSILFYTDGVTEAMNEEEEEYEDHRPLKDFLTSNSPPDAKSFIDVLMEDLHNFTGSTPQSDDITALYLSRED
ncbi:MAG: serine/threonine-protein phosphatase [Calditrichaeota bacterium]|nr:MAG: serine/threonine-protein phosphatase [Calditrichota bacterium]MBL1205779.1 serine/threonine-protein phosphatase [Calditrichota bacterium]NOG45607.1 serine/threonine-protein phosphatase [Calditrichota bacterium]